jgi:hypothetical protein
MANRFLNNIRINDAYTFPASDGNDGQVITTDGAGNLAFENVSPDAASVIYRDNFTGDGNTASFDLQNPITDEDQTQIYIDGVYQEKDTYSVSGSTITFTTAPLNGHSVEVISISSINTGPTVLYQDNFTGNGNDTAFTLGQIIDNEIKTFIFLNGVYQFKNTYTLDGTTLTFDTAPANGVSIEVISIASATQSDSLQAGAVIIPIKNTHTASISKGTPVYITGNVGASERLQIAPADASNSAKMPAAGLLLTTLAVNELGYAITGGYLRNITTDTIDGTSTTSNDTVYVKAGGGLTMTKPTGSNLIQNIAKVARSASGSAGSLIVSSILRTNDIPNLTTGKIWVGDSNTVESTVIHLDESNNRLGINNTSPSYSLDVTGDANISSNVIVGGNLTVQGTETILNTQTVEVEDNILQLNTTQGSPDTATATTSGISIYRGSGVTPASFIFDDADDTWDLTNNLIVASSASDIAFFKSSQATTTNVYITNTNATANNTANLYFAPANNIAGSYIKSTAIEDFSTSANRTSDLRFGVRKDGTFNEAVIIDSSGNSTFAGSVTIEGGELYLGKADTASGHLNSYEVMTFNIDTDNDDTNRYFAFYANGASGSGTELLKILETGNSTFSGIVTVSGTYFTVGGQGYIRSDDSGYLHLQGGTTGTRFFNNSNTTALFTILDNGNATFAGNVTISQPANGSDAILSLISKSGAGNSRTSTIEYDADNEYMYFKNAGTTVATMTSGGNVGIGTTSPNNYAGYTTLTFDGTTGGFLDFESNGTRVGSFLFNNASGVLKTQTAIPLVFATSDTERMRIDSSGNVGIGGSAGDGYRLQVLGTSQNSTTISMTYIGVGAGALKMTSNGAMAFGVDNANGSTERMRIESNGNLLLKGTGVTSLLKFDSSSYGQILSTSNILYYDIDTQVFRNSAGTSEKMRLDSSGNVIVGGTAVDSAGSFSLQSNGIVRGVLASGTVGDTLINAISGVSNGFQITNDASNNQTYKFHSTGGERMRITPDGGGSFAIIKAQQGTYNSVAALSLYGTNPNAYGGSVVSRSSILSQTDGTAFGANLIFKVNNTSNVEQERMRITSGGDIRVTGGSYYNTSGITYVGLNAEFEFVDAQGSPTKRFRPGVDNSFDLGDSSRRWDDLWATNAAIQTSDRNEKNTIKETDLGLDFINKLKPVSYIWNNKTRTHYGLIAQDVQEVLEDISKDTKDFAGFIKADISEEKDNSKHSYGLRYNEFISPMIKAIQELKAEIETLKTQING